MLLESIIVYATHGEGWEPVAVHSGLEREYALEDAMCSVARGGEKHVAVLRHIYWPDLDGRPAMRTETLAEWTRADVEMVELVQALLRIWADYACDQEVPHAAE